MATVDRIKNTELTVLLTGETGTGKDLMAEYIHKTSNRKDKPWVQINIAAIPEQLLESELFGVSKGTFTGATNDRIGLIESADGSTLYLNEIGEIPVSIQVKLLEVLETKAVRRLGRNKTKTVDVRFIAATNQDLTSRLNTGEFRYDLYYRLRQFPIHLPPLRQRQDDIPYLIRYFLIKFGVNKQILTSYGIKRFVTVLGSNHWLGNVRELESMIEHAVALWDGEWPGNLHDNLKSINSDNLQKKSKRQLFIDALKRNGGNIKKTAREFGVPDSTLRYQLKKLGI